ncbi:MAG: aminotransferase class I/II-fold pyridoxal phosphate-dependent enzyme [Actinobacteria bacterium]|nr:aminotransferase class I/II-fold pyridoxal phosphate-dependent enzyme [Actinomycetota bacterium]
MTGREGFDPPPYPYDRLDELRAIADGHDGGCVDLSVGTPTDPPPPFTADVLSRSDAERGYPFSIGSPAFRDAAAGWVKRRLDAEVDPSCLAACIGTKELVAGLPHWLHLRTPWRDTVLYPAISYPSYAMGATLAGCRAVPIATRPDGTLDLPSVDPDDARRALCLWVNSPSNPTGELDDLGAAAAWGRANDVTVFSDECYAEFTWDGRPRTILEHGTDGVVAVHSISKRNNLAGIRAGFYAGDHTVVSFLREVRKHAGFMDPGPVQALAAAAWADDEHVDQQREIYRRRLARLRSILAAVGAAAPMPRGGFYLWVLAPGGDAWAFARRMASELGMLVSPGEFYGDSARDHVRIAAVRPDDRIDLLERRCRG